MSDITVEQDQNSLVVKGKTYSLSVAPDYGDELVQQEVKSVLGQLSLLISNKTPQTGAGALAAVCCRCRQ